MNNNPRADAQGKAPNLQLPLGAYVARAGIALLACTAPVAASAGLVLSKDGAKTATPSDASLAAVEACPYTKLKKAYDAVMSGTDTLDVFAIDKEVFSVCNERSKLIVKLLKGDKKLAALLGASTPQAASAPAGTTKDTASAAKAKPEASGAPSPGAKEAGKGMASVKTASATASVPAPARQPLQCDTQFAMVSLEAAPGKTRFSRGSIVDTRTGADFFVGVGDSLPGGYVVKSIGAQGITLSRQGSNFLLPPNTAEDSAEGFAVAPAKTDSAGRSGDLAALRKTLSAAQSKGAQAAD